MDLTDVTLAFEGTNSKLLDVVIVADVDAEERVDDILVEILKLVCPFLNTGAITPLGAAPAVLHLDTRFPNGLVTISKLKFG